MIELIARIVQPAGKSYVYDTIVTAFEDGILERFAATMKGTRSQSKREQLLAQVVAAAG